MYGGKENSGPGVVEEVNGDEEFVAVADELDDELVANLSAKSDSARELPVSMAESWVEVDGMDVAVTLDRFLAIDTGQRLHKCRAWSQ